MFGHMAPVRQVEAAELMIAMNDFRAYYAHLLLAATPLDKVVRPKRSKIFWGVSTEAQHRIAAESEIAERRFCIARLTYTSDQFALTVAKGYTGKLLRNDNVPAIWRDIGRRY
jgi:hypothetical protein